MVLVLNFLAEGIEAGLQVIINKMLVEGQLIAFFDFFSSIVQPLDDSLLSLSSSVSQSVLKSLYAWCLDEEEVAVYLVIMDLFSSLNINV